jgi:hypothetical protein
MDPFVEDPAFWADFQATFIPCWRDALRAVLPRPYEARIGLVMLEDVREAYIQILHRPELPLVAVLELLSPRNKREPGFGEYVAKRDALIRQDVHLVELDLLVDGHRLPMGGPLPPGDYFAFVSRADRRPHCHVYGWGVRQPLPTLPIPLRPPDPDVPCNLGAVFAAAFERGFYSESPEYGRHLPGGLSPADRAWAQERLPGRQA